MAKFDPLPETPECEPIEKIFGTIDYVIDLINLAKFGLEKFSETEVHIRNI